MQMFIFTYTLAHTHTIIPYLILVKRCYFIDYLVIYSTKTIDIHKTETLNYTKSESL